MITSFGDAIVTIAKALDMVNDSDKQAEADLLLSRGSMTRYLSQFIIEPELKVSKSLKGHEHIQNAINAEFDIFGSLYQTVFNIMLEVYGHDTKFAIQMLSSKDFVSDLISNENSTQLATDFKLNGVRKSNKFLDGGKLNFPLDESLDLEANDKPIDKIYKEIILSAKLGSNKNVSNGSDDEKSREIKIKVLIVASIKYVDAESIYNLIEVEGDMNALESRWDDMMAGAISKLNFFIPLDMISKYKKRRLKDKDDILKAVNNRKLVSASKLPNNNALGFARFYQMITVNAYEKERIEKLLRGSLNKKRNKDNLLEYTKSLIFVVMDDDFEMADIYIHDLKDVISIPYKTLKGGKNNETSEILKFLANRQF